MEECKFCLLRKSLTPNHVDFWCESCESTLGQRGSAWCVECWDLRHKNAASDPFSQNLHHKQIKFSEYKNLIEQLDFKASDEDFEKDCVGSKLIYVHPTDFKLNFARAFYDSTHLDKVQHGVISFVGPTGAGKSSLIRLLMTMNFPTPELHLPIPGVRNSAQSTSSDVHIYFSSPSEDCPLLFLDAEGFNGASEPRGLYHVFSQLHVFLNFDRDVYLEQRKKHVKKSYPKLQYLFSDVICYVTNCNWREREKIQEDLLDWAVKSVSGDTTVAAKPKLLIIFNKTDLNSENATDEFFNDAPTLKKTLNDYYRDTEVLFIPVMKADEVSKALIQLRSLKNVLLSNIHGNKHTGKPFRRALYEEVQKLNEPENITKATIGQQLSSSGHEIPFHLRNYFKGLLYIYGYDSALRVLKCHLRDTPYLQVLRQGDKEITCGIGDPSDLEYVGGKNVYNSINYVDDNDGRFRQCSVPTIPEQWKNWISDLEGLVSNNAPCEAEHTFESYDGPIRVTCSCSRYPHENHTAWNRTYRVKEGFWFWGTLKELPCIWPNPGMPTLQLNLVEHVARQALRLPEWSDQHILANHYGRMQLLRKEHQMLANDKNMAKTCLGCLLSVPSQRLKCGHALCVECCREIMSRDRICPICTVPMNWQSRDLTSTMGYRVLSLDGGGVRSLVELLLLIRIEEILHISCKHLFDAVYGTSTGALLIAAIFFIPSSSSAKAVRELVENLLDKVFLKKEEKFWSFLFNRYTDREFANSLQQLDFDRPLLYCNDQVRIGVTSCLNALEFPEVLFTNYNRPLGDPTEVDNSGNYSVKDALCASCGAGFFFPTYKKAWNSFIDGGMKNNCPARIAMSAAKKLWPNNNCDILLSLGAGEYPSDRDLVNTEEFQGTLTAVFKNLNLFGQAKLPPIIDLTTNNEEIWSEVERKYSTTATRLNPLLSAPVGLTESSKKDILISSTEDFLNSSEHRPRVLKICARLFCSLFVLEMGEQRHDHADFRVKSRIAIPPPARDFMSSFQVKIQDSQFKKTFLRDVFQQAFDQHGYLDLELRIDGLPIIRPLTMVCELEVEIDSVSHCFSISGREFLITTSGEI